MGVGVKVILTNTVHFKFIHNSKQGEMVFNTLFEQLIYPQLPYYHYEDEICIQRNKHAHF